MGLLDGKVVFITGGAQGQGRAHAIASAREGADVAVLDVSRQLPGVEHPMGTPEGLAETARLVEALDRRVLTFEGDVRSQSDLDKAVARTITELGAVDAVIANAGIWTRAPFWEMTEEAWLQTIDVDLNGAWRTVKAVAPHMIERQSGSIVITSSGHGLEPGPDYANYVAAKHGLVGLGLRSARGW
jgi:NAD(P)-dependent dehydrogenase (short-subunit alcohol dehydrogenase family)